MARTNTIAAFVSGAHTAVDKEVIPKDAAASSSGWLTRDGHLELMYGRQAEGAEGSAGKVWAQHFGNKTDGTQVHFRKIWDGTEGKIQYLNGSTWTDVITGLSNSDIAFANYASLAGNFVYMGSPEDGLFKIVTANPGSYADVYDSTKNFKGYILIDRGRMLLWNAENDTTGLYGSYIDAQDSNVYTTVSSEAIGSSGSTNYTGTLAFKAGGSTRTCFGVTFTDGTSSITIDYTGTATASSDGTGTVNFMTGAYDVTFDAATVGAVTADYQWEDSNSNGVTDFTKSATRLAGEGFVVRQDVGGDAIKAVIPFEGSYFSFKERSVYQFTLDLADTDPTNEVIRTNVGIKTRSSVAPTSLGLVYMDTANASDPRLSILKRNLAGDYFTTEQLFEHFDFSEYSMADVNVFTWDEYVVVACNKSGDDNDSTLLCNVRANTVDPTPYDVRCYSTNSSGVLYGGSPVVTTTYEMFTGFDDMGAVPQNSWVSMADKFGTNELKKVKRLRFRGQIAPEQSVKVYVANDDNDFQHVGTILGTGDYVDYNSTYAIGTTYVGQTQVGGGEEATVYGFLMEIKIRTGKFRRRQVKLEATGLGYVEITMLEDYDIWLYEDKIPRSSRQKQNVSISGATTNQDTPEY